MSALQPTSQRLILVLNWHQLAFPSKGLQNISLFIQHEPILLRPYSRQPSPPLKILRIPLVPVRLLRVLPVALAESEEGRNLLARNIVDEGANGAGF